ncbi:hypothetical protein F4604DRAFT_2004364 [Suillus subluteus]|nr:hypothetical protein F4604DRAFT_2004364 [Suillus subluteus]
MSPPPSVSVCSEAPTYTEDGGDNHAGVVNRDMSDAMFVVVMENLLSTLRIRGLVHRRRKPPSAIRRRPTAPQDSRQYSFGMIGTGCMRSQIRRRPSDYVGRSEQPSPVRDGDQKPGIIVGCSALKEASEYSGIRSVGMSEALQASDMPTDRMMKHEGHFMKAAMLDSQLKTLERPENKEGVATVSIEWLIEDHVRKMVRALEYGEEQQHH